MNVSSTQLHTFNTYANHNVFPLHCNNHNHLIIASTLAYTSNMRQLQAICNMQYDSTPSNMQYLSTPSKYALTSTCTHVCRHMYISSIYIESSIIIFIMMERYYFSVNFPTPPNGANSVQSCTGFTKFETYSQAHHTLVKN